MELFVKVMFWVYLLVFVLEFWASFHEPKIEVYIAAGLSLSVCIWASRLLGWW
jgi:hypothetical protein